MQMLATASDLSPWGSSQTLNTPPLVQMQVARFSFPQQGSASQKLWFLRCLYKYTPSLLHRCSSHSKTNVCSKQQDFIWERAEKQFQTGCIFKTLQIWLPSLWQQAQLSRALILRHKLPNQEYQKVYIYKKPIKKKKKIKTVVSPHH